MAGDARATAANVNVAARLERNAMVMDSWQARVKSQYALARGQRQDGIGGCRVAHKFSYIGVEIAPLVEGRRRPHARRTVLVVRQPIERPRDMLLAPGD